MTPAASAQPLTGSEVLIRVRDTGVGITPELLPRIFDMFTQEESSLDRSLGGLGIGLALVKRLTELHGGSVSVSSVLGQGTEFVVRLPVMRDEERGTSGEQKQLEHTASLAPHPSPPATSLRVLVVDDNEDAARMMVMMLENAGHQVRMAHTGLAALQVALEHRPTVMLLDIGLPELNGYEVAKRIRQHPALERSVLIAVTGYGQEADMQTSIRAGFDYHLVKPTDFRNVQQILAIAAERTK